MVILAQLKKNTWDTFPNFELKPQKDTFKKPFAPLQSVPNILVCKNHGVFLQKKLLINTWTSPCFLRFGIVFFSYGGWVKRVTSGRRRRSFHVVGCWFDAAGPRPGIQQQHGSIGSMVGMLVPLKGGIGSIFWTPQEGKDYEWYISGI